jgi:3-oxoacyl-[acyl-carrier protein] reductase
MTGRFEDQVVLVTGAKQGIGRAIADRFLAEGARVAAIDRSVPRRTAVRDERQHWYRVNVANAESVSNAVRDMLNEWGRVDVVVNNAGVTSHIPFVELSTREWERVIGVNLTGTFNVCRAVAPHMIERRQGSIVNIGSDLGLVGAATLVHYSASKGGVIAMSKALARELAPFSIRVNVVAPGPIETPMLVAYPDEYNDRTLATIPLGRWGRPDDVADSVLFAASTEASYYTGWVFSPNGGVVM